MSYRRHVAKPSVALWMLVAIGDLLLILTSAGVLALIAIVSVVSIVGAAWLLMRRGGATNETVPAAVPVAPRPAKQRVTP